MKLLVAMVWMCGIAHAQAGDGLPDPTDRLLRWPLSQSEHPELAPRYAVAKDLAEPGLDWIELCKLGAQKRTVPSLRDQTAYLGAWCAIANNDIDTGVAALQLLAGSSVRGLPAAIRVDLANVLANAGSADRARVLITKHRIRDVVVLDRLTAMFIDMNKRADATEINELAIGFGDHVANACERQARRIVMNPDAYVGDGIDRRNRLLRGAACDELEAELGCWMDLGRCAAFFKAKGRPKLVKLFDAYRGFPPSSPSWSGVVAEAIDALKSERDLAVALDSLERTTPGDCPDPRRNNVRGVLWTVSYRTDLSKSTRERVEGLLEDLVRCDR